MTAPAQQPRPDRLYSGFGLPHGDRSCRSQRAEVDQGIEFAKRWRDGLRDEVFARYAEPRYFASDYRAYFGPPRLVASNGARSAVTHTPFPNHRTCAEW